VLVEGSGGASVFALQFANAMGARVYATSSSPEKCAQLRKLGAVDVIDYKVDQNWGETIYKLAGGGVDRVLDIGGGATLKQSIAASRTGGTLVLVGMLGGISAELNLVDFMLKQQRIRPIAVGSHTMQRRMVRAIDKIGLKPVIDKVFSLADIAAAINYQISGKHVGKIVIDMAV
jgi:NADPH:quinone reductase-like Zn-dependent oxidoreductase